MLKWGAARMQKRRKMKRQRCSLIQGPITWGPSTVAHTGVLFCPPANNALYHTWTSSQIVNHPWQCAVKLSKFCHWRQFSPQIPLHYRTAETGTNEPNLFIPDWDISSQGASALYRVPLWPLNVTRKTKAQLGIDGSDRSDKSTWSYFVKSSLWIIHLKWHSQKLHEQEYHGACEQFAVHSNACRAKQRPPGVQANFCGLRENAVESAKKRCFLLYSDKEWKITVNDEQEENNRIAFPAFSF